MQRKKEKAMADSYWTSVSKRRLSRRRMLAVTGGTAAAGALSLALAGCGSGDDSVEGDSSGLLGKAQDTTRQAKAGGTWPSYYAEDVINMDPIINNASPTFPQLIPVYSQLLKAGISTTEKPGAEDIKGDAAESWEFSPDGTVITLKLRREMKWDPRPPTNGRLLTSKDVRWSWEKFAEVGNSAAELVNSRNPDAAIESIETPDDHTVIFKMAFPYPNVISQLSNQQTFYVMPQLDNFDFGTDMRGSGPYRLEMFRPSSNAVYTRNPDWYDAPRPYFERLERTLIPEYASGLAQFKAQNIWDFEVRAEDVLATKRDHMDMLLLPELQINGSLNGFVNFSKREDSLFKDVRLRRALSMMLDRDLLIETFENVSQFRDAGLPVRIYWNGHLAAGQSEWLDPKGEALGEGAKYFEYNPAEARKLVEAAGVAMPYAAPFGHYSDRVPLDQKRFQVLIAMMSDGGTFQIQSDALLYNSSWRSARQSGGTEFQGLLWHRTADLEADVILTQMYTPQGRNSVDSTGPTPEVTDLVLKQKSELDPKKRTAIIHDIQKKLAMDWPVIPWAGTAPGFTLRWPWLKNHGVFIQGNGSAKSFVYAWYDESQRA
jgi:peptide/nickel transport system substrate-binding protein